MTEISLVPAGQSSCSAPEAIDVAAVDRAWLPSSRSRPSSAPFSHRPRETFPDVTADPLIEEHEPALRGNVVDKLYLMHGCPLLTIWGQRDAIIPVQHAYEVQALVPDMRPETLAEILREETEAAELTGTAREVDSDSVRATPMMRLGPAPAFRLERRDGIGVGRLSASRCSRLSYR